MRIVFFFILFLSLGSIVYSQTKEVSKAGSYYTSFMKESKLSDLEKAYELITEAMKDSKNLESEDAQYYLGLITKQYYESKKPIEKTNYILSASKGLINVYRINKNFKNKEQLFRLMQILGYDLYSEGIQMHKENKNSLAYDLYKNLFEIQSVLAENKLDFTLVSNTGEKTTLSYNDITNNMVVFCINSGKKDEAKALFEKEVSSGGSAVSYARLIQLCFQLDDKSAAYKYIEEGIAKYPADPDLLIFSINRSLDAKEYNAALKQLDEAIRQAPTTALYLVKSQTLESQDKYEESIENYRKGLKLYPNDFDLNYGLGYALFNSSLGILNEQNDATRPKALSNIKEAKEYFAKAKIIDAKKVDFEKIFEQINRVK